MEKIKDYSLSKNIDGYHIFELVKTTPNDSKLGEEIRNYVNHVTPRKKDE